MCDTEINLEGEDVAVAWLIQEVLVVVEGVCDVFRVCSSHVQRLRVALSHRSHLWSHRLSLQIQVPTNAVCHKNNNTHFC